MCGLVIFFIFAGLLAAVSVAAIVISRSCAVARIHRRARRETAELNRDAMKARSAMIREALKPEGSHKQQHQL